jgi:16S rRNA (guanine527-N7)-methyltransferase
MKDVLLYAALAMGISLKDNELELFDKYCEELLFWNRRINLVSIKSKSDIPIKHFIDSLTLLPYIKNTTSQVLDIGAGAGFPGIPLKIAMNSLRVFLVDSSRKKCSFLKHVIRILNLKDTTVILKRAENLIDDKNYRGRFEVVTSRATFKLSSFLQIGTHFLSPGGVLIAMKGQNSDDEITEASKICHDLGFNYVKSYDINLPVRGEFRRIVIYEKTP